jgi:hypothetical protein
MREKMQHYWRNCLAIRLLLAVGLLMAVCFNACSAISAEKRETPVPAKAAAETKEAAEALGAAADSEYGKPQQIALIEEKALSEISGIVAGRVNPGVWWLHNDSGQPAEIYAVSQTGKLLATFKVTGAKNYDWEDLAIGPGRDGNPALYLADIGDNSRHRDELTIYRFAEPKLKNGVTKGATSAAEAFRFRYPNGRHDAEALFVDPASGRIYIVTKTLKPPCGVYRFPSKLTAGTTMTLETVSGKSINIISRMIAATGASAAPDGSRVVIRNYFTAIELRRAKGRPFESIFDAEPVTISIPLEKQGEAIAYSRDSKSIVTVTEKVPAPMYQMMRR